MIARYGFYPLGEIFSIKLIEILLIVPCEFRYLLACVSLCMKD